MIGEWLKQLFGESEGKDGKGLLPASVTFTTDLHSMGQFIQQGSKVLFETIIMPSSAQKDLKVGNDDKNLDGLNYLAGKKLSYINKKAFEGTLDAHVNSGNVPANVVSFKKMDEYNLGNLMYFFMRTCAYTGYLLEVNPFNQPGVEIYKHNMFVLLGKPGVK
jgi:glucose-6-phosphate isomerase